MRDYGMGRRGWGVRSGGLGVGMVFFGGGGGAWSKRYGAGQVVRRITTSGALPPGNRKA